MRRLTHAMKLDLLWRSQAGVCAGCGLPVRRRLKRAHDPDAPSFDHVIPLALGGSNGLANGLLKHVACNRAKGHSPPTGCDRIWLEAARVRRARLTQERKKAARSRTHGLAAATPLGN